MVNGGMLVLSSGGAVALLALAPRREQCENSALRGVEVYIREGSGG